MAILKFKDKGEWKSIAAFKGEDGKDGAIQYKPGPGINISEDNIISATFSGEDGVDITVDAQPLPDSTNPVASGGVYTALQDKADKSEIKTDTSELTNGAGFITGGDIPKDLGDFDNEAGFLKEETDPLFSRSVAASITDADKALWNRVEDLHICPLIISGNYSDSSSFNVTSSTVLNKLRSYIDKYGVWGTAIYLVTNYRAGIYLPVRDAVTGTSTGGTYVWTYKSIKANDNNSDVVSSRLVVNARRSDGVYTKIEVGAYSAITVAPSAVLKKTNTTAYTPTEAYHPATKQYVDDKVAAGVEGIGGITSEEDPTVPAWVKNITEADISNWNNKADSGGINQELDPTVPIWVKGITEDDIASWNNKLDEMPDISGEINDAIDNALSGAGYLSEEEDPLFVNSPAASITDEDKTRWNNKLDASNLYHRTTTTLEVNVNSMTNTQISALIPFLKQFLYKADTGVTVRDSLLQSSISIIQKPSSTTYYRGSTCAFFDHMYTNKSYQVTDHIFTDESQATFYGGKLGTYDSAIAFIDFSLHPHVSIGSADTSSIIGWRCEDRDSYGNAMSFQWNEYVLFFNMNNVISDNPDTTEFALVRTKDQYCGFGNY